jgi:hypothetical protein
MHVASRPTLAVAVCVLLTSAATAVAAQSPNHHPPSAGKTPNLYSVVQSATISAPSGTRTNGEALCPAGTVAWGGGASIASTSTSVSLGNSFPFGGGGNNGWFVTVSNQSSATVTFVVQTVCAAMPRKYRIVTSTPFTAPAAGQLAARAKCPGTAAVFGGGSISQNAVTISSAYPGSDKRSWNDSVNNPTTAAASFQVVMVCGRAPSGATLSAGTVVSAPKHTQKTATVACPAGKPLAGGALSSSTSTAVTLSSSVATANGWSVAESNGSGAAASVQAYVICA